MECALKSSLRKEMGVKVLTQQDDFWAVDGQNVVACDDFFVDELLDLSNEDDAEKDEPVEKREEDEKQRECEEIEVGFAGKDEFSDIPTGEITVPAEDLWLSHFVEDSFSEFPAAPFLAGATPEKPMEMVPVEKIQGRSGSGEARFATPVPAKARSKRVRSGGRVWSSLTESSATPTSSATSSSSCSSPTSPWLIYAHPHPNPVYSGPNRVWKKQRKAGTEAVAAAAQQPPRRCSHCGVQKTPQWRTGPLGAKTLCNACGVRFKSGRLLPEYRPACSPTFSSELHSNHHRKVMEMRRKKEAPPLPDSGLAPRAVASF